MASRVRPPVGNCARRAATSCWTLEAAPGRLGRPEGHQRDLVPPLKYVQRRNDITAEVFTSRAYVAGPPSRPGRVPQNRIRLPSVLRAPATRRSSVRSSEPGPRLFAGALVRRAAARKVAIRWGRVAGPIGAAVPHGDADRRGARERRPATPTPVPRLAHRPGPSTDHHGSTACLRAGTGAGRVTGYRRCRIALSPCRCPGSTGSGPATGSEAPGSAAGSAAPGSVPGAESPSTGPASDR